VKHTPGPWHVSERGGHIIAGPYAVAQVFHSARPVDAPHNARLIAAAPIGYDLAVEIIRGNGTADSQQRAIELARELLRRVEAEP
jgi:hypothetical protein